MLLLVGPNTSGKTRFAKQLQEYLTCGRVAKESDLNPTIPTVGTNMTTLHISRKETVEMRELGGSMAPIWKKYYKDSSSVIFLADKSNPHQMSAFCILLLDLLSNADLQSVPFLILWNKIDSENCMADSFIKDILDPQLVAEHARQNVETLNCSSFTGEGFAEVISWMQQTNSS